MSFQVNIRIDEEMAKELDELAVEQGVSRPELVRQAVTELVKRRESERIAERYRRAYTELPETDEEKARAYENARRYVDEEPWEKWW